MTEVLIGSILSALSTGVGALPILFLNQELTHRWKDILLALTAGIMTAASTMSLIPESLQSGGFFLSHWLTAWSGNINTLGAEYSSH